MSILASVIRLHLKICQYCNIRVLQALQLQHLTKTQDKHDSYHMTQTLVYAVVVVVFSYCSGNVNHSPRHCKWLTVTLDSLHVLTICWRDTGLVFSKQCLICPVDLVLKYWFNGVWVPRIGLSYFFWCCLSSLHITNKDGISQPKKQFILFISRGSCKPLLSVCGMCVRSKWKIRERWGIRAQKRESRL